MNVGASSPTAYGNYYKYGKGNSTYTNNQSDFYTGTEDPLSMSVDTARQAWGGLWHMPTRAQLEELRDQCTWTWGSNNGINGYTVSKNGKSIFLPAAGYCSGGYRLSTGAYCMYWGSTPYNGDYSWSYYLHESLIRADVQNRKFGFQIHGVIG